MQILKIINLIAVAGYTLLGISAFFPGAGMDAAGRGMAQGFAVVLFGFALVGLVLALFNTWATQIIAFVILMVPLLYQAKGQLEGLAYKRAVARQAELDRQPPKGPADALLRAIRKNNAADVTEVLREHPELANHGEPGQRSLLEIALLDFAYTGSDARLAVAEALLKHGADPNAHPGSPKPLITETDNIVKGEVFRLLLEHGADARSVDDKGRTVLWQVVRHFGEESDKVKLLLEKGADPNTSGTEPVPPLVIAAQRRHWSNALLLLQHGADPNLPAAAEFWGYYDTAAASYAKYRDAPPGFVEVSQLPVIKGKRP